MRLRKVLGRTRRPAVLAAPSGKLGRMVQCASPLERLLVAEYDMDAAVVAFTEWTPLVAWSEDGVRREHRARFLVAYRDGGKELHDPAADAVAADPAVRRREAALIRALAGTGLTYRLRTAAELGGNRAAVLRRLVRHRLQPIPAGAAAAALEHLDRVGRASLAELGRLAAAIKPATAYALVAQGRLAADLDQAPGPDFVVRAVSASAMALEERS